MRILSLVLLSFILFGCGNLEPHKKARYNLSLTQGKESFIPLLISLINSFNLRAGQNILHWESNPAKSTSTISVIEDLPSKPIDGKTGAVGLGRFVITSKFEPIQIKYYDMDIWLDANFLEVQPRDQSEILFFHEVGHGLELEHNLDDASDIMYTFVGDDSVKDYEKFFSYVRNYISDK